MSTAPTNRLRSAAENIPNPFPYPISVAGKFLLCGAIGQILWLVVIQVVESGFDSLYRSDAASVDPHLSVPDPSALAFFGVLFLPPLAVAVVYTRLPDETADWYHRFGKGSAMFFTLNVSLSASFVLHKIHFGGMTASWMIMGTWALASLFLPGLYIGCLVAARWSR